MFVEDYLDAVSFRTGLFPPPIDDWCDDLKRQRGEESFRGIG